MTLAITLAVIQYTKPNEVNFMKIKQLGSNQIELHTKDGTIVLFSYDTPVAALINNGYVKTDTKYSNTTTKHINKWLAGVDAPKVSQDCLNLLIGA